LASLLAQPHPNCRLYIQHTTTARDPAIGYRNGTDSGGGDQIYIINDGTRLFHPGDSGLEGSSKPLFQPSPHPLDRARSYTQTVLMKNITLSIDEKVLAAVRRYALEHESSINGLVREFLTRIAYSENRSKKARRQLRVLSNRSKAQIETVSWNRDSRHER
jgi:hypothetical protein